MGACISWENRSGIGILTLNRPEKHNALDDQLVREIGDAIEACQTDDSVKVLVIQGAGKSFCSGGDLKGNSFLTAGSIREREQCLKMLHRIPLGLRKLPQPVIGAIHGMAVGGGMDLALNCDIRIASTDAKFGMLFGQIGLMPDGGGSYQLPRLVGTAKALELLFTGDLIDAQEALRIGVVNQVVPREELEEKTLKLAGRLAKGALQAYRITKETVYKSMGLDLQMALDQEIAGQVFLMDTEDAQEGVRAFAEGRKPVFTGK